MNSPTDLDALNPDQLRALARQLMTQVDEKTRESHYRQTRIDQLTHELSVIKRLQFGRRSEQFTAEQLSLLDEAIDEDLAALEAELDELRSDAPQEKPRKRAKRLPLPPQLPRTDILEQSFDKLPECTGQIIRRIFDQIWHAQGDVGNALRHNDAVLTQQAADLVGLGSASPYEALAHPVQGEHGLLFDIFDRHEPHRRPRHCLANGFGIGCVVFVAFHIRFHKLRCHQSDRMAKRL